jgi:hypothetical protein
MKLRTFAIAVLATSSISSLALADEPAAPAPAPDAAAPAIAPPGTAPTPPVVPKPATAPAPDVASPKPAAPTEHKEPSFVIGKYSAQFYGFIEADAIHDSTQSFEDLQGNSAIAKPGTYGGEHGRTTFGARNSRLGFKFSGPPSDTIRASAVFEMDFLATPPTGTSESATYGSPFFRIRHANFKVETPIVDVLFGQTWQLFGWQPTFHPATVAIQGIPGQVYSRAVQARVSKHIHTDPVDLDIAVAGARPPQRDSEAPDLQGGLKLTINSWKGWHSSGSTGGAIDGISLGVSGVFRSFAVQDFAANPGSSTKTTGQGLSFDLLLPVIPATAENNDNALTLTGSFVTGRGISDLFTGLNGGVVSAVPAPVPPATTIAFVSDIDRGLVAYDGSGGLHAIQWTSILAGLQYRLPVAGLWVAGTFSHMHSNNSTDFGGKAAFNQSLYVSGALFWDANKAMRFGGEYSHTEQTYGDDAKAKNERVQLSAFYIF